MTEDRSKPYRCSVLPEDAECQILLGRKKIKGEIVDLSREDFRVRVPRKFQKRLLRSNKVRLCYHGECWSVKGVSEESEGANVLNFQRVAELTPVKLPSPWTSLLNLQMSRDTDPRFVLALLLAFIALSVALPGIGDKLGTAPRIKTGVQNVIHAFK